MKKIICFILSIVISSFLLVGCNSNKDVGSEELVKDFVTEMYTMEDYKKIDLEKMNWEFPKDQYSNEIMKISTEEAMKNFTADRIISIYLNRLYKLHVNSEVTLFSIDENSREDDGSIIYNYEVKLKFAFTDTNKEKEEELLGQVTVKKVESKWVITKFNKVQLPLTLLKP
jgi:hypothetical protein